MNVQKDVIELAKKALADELFLTLFIVSYLK